TVPMQDVGAAVAEMERAVGDLGLKGLMINDHVNGQTYDQPQFLPFWMAAEKLGAVILFHQYGPTVVTARTNDYFLPNTIGNLVDRTITFATLVFGGVMDRFPGLKLCLAHGGGYTAFGVARMDKGWEAAAIDYMPHDARRNIDRPPSAYLGSFYYDCATFSERTLRFLIDSVGIGRVVFGTDYPAPMVIEDAVNWVNGLASLSDEEKDAILWGNPARLLGL
ncbi:MAG: aminocarboxymuconate-semialdehyde decarboxylase, partial [Gemmatimonadetes bacterium]|nr:aminocarboxymuconate-semialdehyde decarboxylase [Gemmatimonadota bacterium]